MKKFNIALASFGMSGWVFHAPFIDLHPGFEFYAVWERTKNLAEQKYPGVITYRSFEEMINDSKVDLVIVNTPNFLHFDLARKALLAGKHVVVEKPFTITVKDADELIALATLQKKQISVFQNRRWDSDFKTVQDVVQKKLLGEIVEAEIHYDRFNDALSPKVHKETPGPGTGIHYDLGSHLIDQAIQLFGMPEGVFADFDRMRPVSFVDDYMEILLLYPLLKVRLKGTYLAREAVPSFVLHGTKGSFLKSRADTQELRLQANESPSAEDWGIEPEEGEGLLHTEIDGKIVREKIPSLRGNYLAFYEQLYQSLAQDAPLQVTAADGRNVIHVIEKAMQSAEEKRVVAI